MTIRKSPPSLRRHKPSKQGVATLSDRYLGHWPDGHMTPPAEVRDAYKALVAGWLANGLRTPDPPQESWTAGKRCILR